MLSCHATSLSGWAVPGSPATFSRPDQASCRKKKAQKAKSRKSARPPCGNCHTRIFLVYAFRKAGAFCESIISACDVTTDPRQKKPQQALSEPGSAAVGRSMACTQGRDNRLATVASHRTAQPLGAAWHARRATEFAEAVFAKVIFQERPFFVRSSRRRG